jgi:RimJ/RimL family protein N-acetyltransferase
MGDQVTSGVVPSGTVSPVDVALRPLEDGDLDALFEMYRDPVSVWMAAFTPPDPDDRAAFDAHMSKIRRLPDVVNRAVVSAGLVIGSVASFVIDGRTEITYWLDRSVWGRGLASRAVALFLNEMRVRPLYARAASDNAGSLGVLRRAGFMIIGRDTGFAQARGTEIEETILRLDEAP